MRNLGFARAGKPTFRRVLFRFGVLGAALVVFAAAPSAVFAQTPYLVKDINTGSDSGKDGFPWNVLVECGEYLYFSGESKLTGEELWRTDGTEAGTQLVVEGAPGYDQGTRPWYFACVGSTLFFAGSELWKTDGTAAGTSIVMDINPGSAGSWPKDISAAGGLVYFRANDGTHGDEPWVSDGSTAGTIMLGDLKPGSSGSVVGGTEFFEFGGYVYLSVDSNGTGRDLWRSDGTPAGTELFAEIGSPAGGGPQVQFLSMSSSFFFVADDGVHGYELWKSDGTEVGTAILKDINPTGSSHAYSLCLIGSTLFFSADDGTTGTELWKSDGTDQGTVQVKDINPDGDALLGELTPVGDILFFPALDEASGVELWKSDGTESGTTKVKEINPEGDGYPTYLEELDGVLFFAADDGTNGVELWKTDGTESGTLMVKNIGGWSESGDPAFLKAWDEALYFAANDGSTGRELWRSDGTAAGTVLVKNVHTEARDSEPTIFVEFDGRIFFKATTASSGTELWTTDGTPDGTFMVKDIQTGTSSSSPYALNVLGDLLLFGAAANLQGKELWKSDGTPDGTVLVKDIRPGAESSTPGWFASLPGAAVFGADDGIHGIELWKTDGTPDGTVMVEDIHSGPEGSDARYLESVGGVVVFRADDGANGTEPWVTDGTEEGTRLLADIFPGPTGSWPTYFHLSDGTLYFQADDGTRGAELWATDGTPEGTRMVKDINPGEGDAAIGSIASWNGIYYFNADDGVHGRELWRSDGTASGTFMVKDFWSGPDSSHAGLIGFANNSMIVSAQDDIHGRELWVTDGSGEGTSFLYDIVAGPDWWYSYGRESHDGFAYFSAFSPEYGIEIWKTDGTSAGTGLVADIRPGPESGYSPLTNFNRIIGNRLLFTAVDNEVGIELWGMCVGVYYADTDGDGRGSPDSIVFGCTPPEGSVANNDDCDDSDSTVYPGAAELCDLKDNDCDGPADEPDFAGLASAHLTADSDCTVQLDWPAAGEAPCGGVVTYSVFRGLSSDFQPSIANRIAEDLTSLSFHDTHAIAPNGTYHYIVRATAAGFEDANLVRHQVAVTGCAGRAPDPPAFFTARATDDEVLLEWFNPDYPYSHTRVCWSSVDYVTDPSLCGVYVHDEFGPTPGYNSAIPYIGTSNGSNTFFTAWVYFYGPPSHFSKPITSSARPFATPSEIPWAFSTGASALAPVGVRHGDALFMVSNDRALYSVVAGSSGGIWPVGWKPSVMNGPAQARPVPVSLSSTTVGGASEVIFTSSEDGHVYAFDSSTGAELWRSPRLGDSVLAAPSVLLTEDGGAYDAVLVGSRTPLGDSRFYGLDLQTGAVLWAFDNGGGDSGIGIISGEAQVDLDSNRVYFTSRRKAGGSTNTLWCLELVDSPSRYELIWAVDIGDVDGSPVLNGGILYVGNNRSQVHALDPADGSLEWDAPFTPVGGSDGPVKGSVWVDTSVTPTQLYFATTTKVHGIADNGTSPIGLSWSPIDIASPSPVIAIDDDLWVGSSGGNGSLRRINKNTGAAIAFTVLGDPAVKKAVGAPTFDLQNSLIAVGTDEGRVYTVEVP